MKLVRKYLITYILLNLLLYGCHHKNKEKRQPTYEEWESYKRTHFKTDTIDTIVTFRILPYNKLINGKKYSSLFLPAWNNKDTLGYYRKEDNKIFYLAGDYSFYKHSDNPGKEEQVLFNFNDTIGTKKYFLAHRPFIQNNVVVLKDKKYSERYKDTIYYYDRIDTLSTQDYEGHQLVGFSIGKEIGFVNFIWTDNITRYRCYKLKGDSTWRIF